jgi:hypothetical protein
LTSGLTSFTAQNLKYVGGDFALTGDPALASINVNSLVKANNILIYIAGPKATLNFPALTNATKLEVQGNWTNVQVPVLKYLSGNLDVESELNVADIDCSSVNAAWNTVQSTSSVFTDFQNNGVRTCTGKISKGLAVGIIVGIAVACLIPCLLFCAALAFWMKRKRARRNAGRQVGLEPYKAYGVEAGVNGGYGGNNVQPMNGGYQQPMNGAPQGQYGAGTAPPPPTNNGQRY